ncbi:Peroxisomal trans-2-enoyl-CoA reductase [Exaiptasia diaphana]|nr:Peroxisomal trans-2-enoyl-CoA reductase [Exaiptasia diaphana]
MKNFIQKFLNIVNRDSKKLVVSREIAKFLAVRSYAISLAPRRITCNCIIPGVTKSDAGVLVFGQGDEKKFEETAAKMCPMKAGIAPEDIGEAAAFLCSSKASFITGVNLDVDGGLRFRLR